MANRYWVGGAGAWNNTNTANWSTSSGGSGGASIPTSTDDVFIDANSGGGTIMGSFAYANCASLDTTGFTGALTSSVNVWGGSTTLGTTGTYTGLSIRAKGTGGSYAASASNLTSGLYVQLTSGIYTLTGTLRCQIFSIESGSISASTATIRCSSATNYSTQNSTVGTITSPPDDASDNCFCSNRGSGGFSVVTLKYCTSLGSTSSGLMNVQAFGGFRSLMAFIVSSTGGLTIPSWPTSAQISSLFIQKTGQGTITPSVPISFSNYTSLGLAGSYIGVSSATNIGSLRVENGASLAAGAATSQARVEGDSYVDTLNFSGSLLTLHNNTPTTTVIGTLNSTGSNLTIDPSFDSTGTIGTLNFGLSNSGIFTAKGSATLRVNNLNIGAPGQSQIVTSSAHPTTQAKIEAVSSFSLQGIEWRSIDADGIVPFTGTDFVDGGNNLDISLGAGRSPGLFFGSNF